MGRVRRGEVKLRAYEVQRDVVAIPTSDAPIYAHRGDVVIVAVVERWEDAPEALKRIVQKVEED